MPCVEIQSEGVADVTTVPSSASPSTGVPPGSTVLFVCSVVFIAGCRKEAPALTGSLDAAAI